MQYIINLLNMLLPQDINKAQTFVRLPNTSEIKIFGSTIKKAQGKKLKWSAYFMIQSINQASQKGSFLSNCPNCCIQNDLCFNFKMCLIPSQSSN